MAYCGPRGIPLDEFLSWSQHSQDAAIQWAAHESRRCPDCGTHPEDWDPAKGGSRTYKHWHPQVCLGCQGRQRSAAALAKDQDATKGLHLVAATGSAGDCPICT